MNQIIIDNETAYEYKYNPNYYVTKSGKIYSIYVKGGQGSTDINNPHLLSYGIDSDGYYRVVISNNGNKKYIKVHTMIAQQFIGNIPDNKVINHIDGDKRNNDVSNLEIVTPRENTIHAHKNNLTSTEKSVQVEYRGCVYYFQSLKDCMDFFPDISRNYLNQIRNGVILFSMVLFKKKKENERISEIETYYNGELYRTFSNMKVAGLAFNKSKGSIFSAIKNCEYREKVNQYKITFPNVSTIESTDN